MTLIKTWKQGQVTIDLNQKVYETLQKYYNDIPDFVEHLQVFNADLTKNKNLYNINAHPDKFNKGVYILGKDDSELGIFPDSKLALKCSQGQFWAENLRKQFHTSIRLAQHFETRLTVEEKALLQLCPVYLHFQTRQANAFFKQILFMQRVDGGITLGYSKSGFDPEFCRVFKIPSIDEIAVKPQFALHRFWDKNKKRQLLKIQTVYLFKRLLRKGIKIFSLNQKNILVTPNSEAGQFKYTIIDPTTDFFPPLSPLYNILTNQLCN